MIVGFDPGTKNLGMAVMRDDGSLACLATLSVRGSTPSNVRFGFLEELCLILRGYYNEGDGDLTVACEGVYVKSAPRLAIELGKVVGLIQAACVAARGRFVEIAPAQGRKALTERGDATDKEALEKARKLSGRSDINIHEADALGVALAAYWKEDKND